MQHLSPSLVVHTAAALFALLLGPWVLYSRRGQGRVAPGQPGGPKPGLHRALGRIWVLMMVTTALSALLIHPSHLPNVAGFSPLHLFTPLVLWQLWRAFAALRRGHVGAHRKHMLGLYLGGCVVAGGFTLLPGRFLGQLVWGQWLGWL